MPRGWLLSNAAGQPCDGARMDFAHSPQTRLTNALFSKKMKNHAHAMALHFLYYNFGRIHKTLVGSGGYGRRTGGVGITKLICESC